jgi:hypothetical protein
MAAEARGCGITRGSCGIGCAAAGRFFVGPPFGPPGLSSLPVVIGFAGSCFPFGIGRLGEFGASPGPTWIVEDLYISSRGIVGSFLDLTTTIFPGFLEYSMVGPMRTSIPARSTLFKRVTSSVLKTQDISGSGACGEPIPRQNQSSRRFVMPTYLMDPRGMLCSAVIDTWLLTRACTMMYTALLVCVKVLVWIYTKQKDTTNQDDYPRTGLAAAP